MQNELTIVVPSSPGGISMATARAYEHLVACELVRPCVWVEESETGELVGAKIGVRSAPVEASDDAHWWEPELVPLLELIAREEPSRIRLVSLVLPGGHRPDGVGADWQSHDLAGRASRACEQYRSDLQELSQYAMFIPTVDTPAGMQVEASLDPAMLRDQPWLNVLVAPEDRADDGSMAVPVACDTPLPFHIASAIASLTATWHGMGQDPLEAWADPPLNVSTANRSRLVIMRSRSRSLTIPTTADSVPAAVLAKRASWPVPVGCVGADAPMMLVDQLTTSYIEGPGDGLRFHTNREVIRQESKGLTVGQLFRMIWNWIRNVLPGHVIGEVHDAGSRIADRFDDYLTRKILGPNSAFRVDRHGRDLVIEQTEEGEVVDVLEHLARLGGLELMSRRPQPNPEVWRSFLGWSFSVIDGSHLPGDLESLFSDGSFRQVITDPDLVAPRSDDVGWWAPSPRIANLLGAGSVRLRPCDPRMARRNLQYLEDVVIWVDAVVAAEAAAAAKKDAGDDLEEEIVPSRWRIVRWWRTKRLERRRRRDAKRAKKGKKPSWWSRRVAKKAAKKKAKRAAKTAARVAGKRSVAPVPVPVVPTVDGAAMVPEETPVGRPLPAHDEAPTEIIEVPESDDVAADEGGVAEVDTTPDLEEQIPAPPGETSEEADSDPAIPTLSGEVEIDTSFPSREEIQAAAKSLSDAIDARSLSFAWRVGTRLDQEMDRSLATFDRFVKELDEATANPPELVEEEMTKRRKRRLRWSIFRGGFLLLAAVLGAIFLPLALVVLVPLFAIFILSAVASLVGGIWSYARDKFRADHDRADARKRIDFVKEEIPKIVVEMVRLHSNYVQFLDWSESVGAMVHRPFGPPMRYQGRTHGTWVGGLHAHQVGEGEIGSNTEISLINSQSAEVFQRGWLNEVWSEASTEVADEFRLLTAANDIEADPYSDRTTTFGIDPVRDRSARRFLLQMIEDGTPLTTIRSSRMEQILDRLARLSPDRLCDAVEGREPERWLVDSVPRDGAAAAFPLSLWTTDGLMSLPSVDYRTVWTPASLGDVASNGANVVRMRPNTGTLASTVVCVDLSSVIEVTRPESIFSVFGEGANPPVDRVAIPSTVRLGTTREFVAFGGSGPDIGHLPQLGDSIVPRSAPRRPAAGGSYRFMFLVDGRPCRYPADRPIDFHVRVGVGPEEGFQLVRDALQVMSDASGITFRFAGTFIDLAEREPENGGLWISYVEPEDFAGSGAMGLGDGVLGHGGVNVSGDTVVGGVVVIGNDPNVEAKFGRGHTLGGVLLHEIGHALNLAHVDVQSELMFPYASEFTPETLGNGDRLGLWLMGAGRGRH